MLSHIIGRNTAKTSISSNELDVFRFMLMKTRIKRVLLHDDDFVLSATEICDILNMHFYSGKILQPISCARYVTLLGCKYLEYFLDGLYKKNILKFPLSSVAMKNAGTLDLDAV